MPKASRAERKRLREARNAGTEVVLAPPEPNRDSTPQAPQLEKESEPTLFGMSRKQEAFVAVASGIIQILLPALGIQANFLLALILSLLLAVLSGHLVFGVIGSSRWIKLSGSLGTFVLVMLFFWSPLTAEWKREHPSSAVASISDKRPPTLLDLFKSDFPTSMKLTDGDRLGIQWQNGEILHISTQVYLDFPSRVKFVGFYVPASAHTLNACLKLVESPRSTIEHAAKQLEISAGYRGEQNRPQDLVFSGRVVLYHENFLSIPQKAEIIKTYSASGFDVNFRGPDYLGDQVIAWHNQHDARVAH